jgi:3-methyladenine DNA glycosylase/8-oxoguanine DNA glycosylase
VNRSLTGEDEAVQCLIDFIGGIDKSELPTAWGRASAPFDHVGAKLADAALQRGVNYETMVRPRVEALVSTYPDANTTSGLIRLLKKHGAPKMLQIKGGMKSHTFLWLARELAERRIETVAELQEFLADQWHANSLRRIKGVGPKTVAFLKLIVGLDAVAVDLHILAAFEAAGVPPCDPSEAEELIGKVAERLGMRMSDIDALIWQHQARPSERRAR